MLKQKKRKEKKKRKKKAVYKSDSVSLLHPMNILLANFRHMSISRIKASV